MGTYLKMVVIFYLLIKFEIIDNFEILQPCFYELMTIVFVITRNGKEKVFKIEI